MRQGLARQHLVAHGGVVHKNGFHHRGLRQVLGLQAFVGVHVRVVRARAVIERVLDKLESRNADCVERFVIGASGIAHGQRVDAKVVERLNPLREDRRDGRILLQVNAADFSCAVVHVEVAGDLLLIGFGLHRAGRFAYPLRQLELVGSGGQRHIAEMLLDVTVGTELAFFLARPQCHADGATRLHLQRVEDAHHLHGDNRACAIVGCARTRSPRIQMPAHHDNFVFQLRIGAGDFRDGVVAVFVVAGKFGVHVHLEGDRDARLQKAIYAAIILNGHHHQRERIGVLPFVCLPAKAGAAVVEDGPARTSTIAAVAAWGDDRQGMLVRQKLSDLPAQLQALHVLLDEVPAARLDWILGKLLQFGVVQAHPEGFFDGRHVAHGAIQHDLPSQFALVFIEVLSFVHVDPDRGRIDRAIRRRRPRR